MGGINVQAIAELLTAIKVLLSVGTGLIGLFMIYRAITKATWAVQMGGINSMGTKDFTSEALLGFAGGLVTMNVSLWAAAGAADLMGVDNVTWRGVTAQTEDPMKFIGEFIIASFWLIGFTMIGKSGISAPKISEGQISAGTVFFYFCFGIVMMNFEWLNAEITNLVPFNPMAVFFDQPIFRINS